MLILFLKGKSISKTKLNRKGIKKKSQSRAKACVKVYHLVAQIKLSSKPMTFLSHSKKFTRKKYKHQKIKAKC